MSSPANIRLGEDVLKTSFVFIFRRRLQDIFKTYWSRRIYSPNSYVFRRRFQDVFKTSSRCLAKTSSKRLQDIFKTSCKNVSETSSRHFQDVFKTSSNVFKTSSRCLAKISSRRFQTHHQGKLFLLTRFQMTLTRIENVSETYCKDGYL